MIAHVGEGHPRRNAQAPRPGCQQRRFRNAESSFGAQAIARPEITSRFSPIIGVVEDPVAHRVVELHSARDTSSPAAEVTFPANSWTPESPLSINSRGAK